jgi:hypothetical protein
VGRHGPDRGDGEPVLEGKPQWQCAISPTAAGLAGLRRRLSSLCTRGLSGLFSNQPRGRLPLSLGQYLFDANNIYDNRDVWPILHYSGSDVPASVDPIAAADTTNSAVPQLELKASLMCESERSRSAEPDKRSRGSGM